MNDPDSARTYHLRRAQQEAVSAIRAGAARIAALHDELSLRHSLAALAMLMLPVRFAPAPKRPAAWYARSRARPAALRVRYADGPWLRRPARPNWNRQRWDVTLRLEPLGTGKVWRLTQAEA